MAKTPTSITNSARERRRSAGFTLVELLVVLGLLALAYALIAPSLSRTLAGNDLRLAARELAAALNQARAGALSSGREQRFVVDAGARAYGSGQATRVLPAGIEIQAAIPESRRPNPRIALIDFFPDGSSTGGTVTLGAANGVKRSLTVDYLTGRVTADE